MRSQGIPKISVIMPTYNRWNLLCEALESVMQQTYPHWEAVVVNDGGTPPPDPAAEMLRRRGVVYIEHPGNRGLAAARNTGLSRCTGEFVAYLDDDDVFYPDHLEVLVREMTSHGWDVAYADAMRGTYETTEGKIRLLGREPAYGKDFSREDFWSSNYIPVLCVVHRRGCIEQAGNFDPLLPALEDWDLWLRMSSRYDFHHIPRVTSMFRVTTDGLNMTDRINRRMEPELKARIYAKYLKDPAIVENREVRDCLIMGIFQLLRDFMPRFVGELARGPGSERTRSLFRFLPWRYKRKLFLRDPWLLPRYYLG